MKKRLIIKKALLLILAIVLTISFSSCTIRLTRFTKSYFYYFDTVSYVVSYDKNLSKFNVKTDLIEAELEYYNKLFDIYHTYEGVANIKTINDNAGSSPVKVDSELIDFLKWCKDIYTLTDGKVNIAFGSVLRVWHDAREISINNPENSYIPSMDDLIECAKHCDIDSIIINEEDSTVFITDADTSIDVGAVAKGYAEKMIIDKLEEKGLTNVSLSLGGNVKVIGLLNGDTLFRVAVQDPFDQEESMMTLKVTDVSIVTSGSYQRFYEYDGNIYHHIIDTDTLMPANYAVSVTIICADPALSDALSTYLFVIDPSEGIEVIENLDDVECMYVLSDKTVLMSSGFESYIDK